MIEHPNNDKNESLTETAVPSGPLVWLDEAVLIVLLLLSIGGAVISDFSPQDAYLYWLVMIPVFAIGSIIASWAKTALYGHIRGRSFGELLLRQVLHWGGTFCTVIGVFFLLHLQFLDSRATALVILLILGLATFLDGIRIGWRFSLAGVFLGVTALLTAYLEQFLPLVALLAVLLIVITIYWGKRERSRRLPKIPS